MNKSISELKLWFDVGIKRYTTVITHSQYCQKLWFDVGIKRYTTCDFDDWFMLSLWFDVGIKRYTTELSFPV